MKYVYNSRVQFSQTGFNEGFSVIGAAQVVEDSVCAFFASFGKDSATICKDYNAIWVFVKNKIQKRAKVLWNEKINVESYFTKISPATVTVDTVVKNSAGETAILARTEICAIDFTTQRVKRISSLDLPELKVYQSTAGFDFTRFQETALREEYKFNVPSTSIDSGRHLNNVEYLRFILNVSSVNRELENPVCETEINFVAQARENELLTVYSGMADGKEIYLIKSGDTVVVRCALSRGKR